MSKGISRKKYSIQKGWGLVETLLTLGTISALSMAIYMTFAPTDVSAQTKAEQSNLQNASEGIFNSYGLLNNFSNVSSSSVISEGLVSNSLISSGQVRSAWDSTVEFIPYSIINPNDSFAISYASTPKSICARLSSAGFNGAYDVLVDGTSVLTASRAFNPVAAGSLCQEGSELTFVFSGYGDGVAIAADPLDLPTAPPSQTPVWDTPITNVVSDPGGVADAPGLLGNTPDPTSPVTPPAIVAIPPTPSTPGLVTAALLPIPAPGITVLTPCSPLPNQYQDINACVAGSYGQVRQELTYSCPEAWEAPVASSWINFSDTCVSCPSDVTEFRNQWVAYTVNQCASGSYGFNNRRYEQEGSRNRFYLCPFGTQNLPAPSFSAWSAWSNNGNDELVSNVCSSCPAPSTGSERQWIAFTGSCPAGNYGSTGNEQEQERNRSINYVCPFGTSALPSPTYGGWSGWFNTGATRPVSSSCTTCPAAASEQELTWGNNNLNRCAAGTYGYHVVSLQSSRTRTRSYVCPAGTAVLPAPSYTAWTGWSNTGVESLVSTNCSNCPGSTTGNEYQWASPYNDACPVGQTGNIVMERQQVRNRSESYFCPYGTASLPGITYGAWGGWSNTGATRVASNTCVAAPVMNGTCPSRPIVIGCAVYDAFTNARITPVSISNDEAGEGFYNGQYVRCSLGYADSIAFDGFPNMDGQSFKYILKHRGAGPFSDWDVSYFNSEEAVSYVEIFARNADGTQGNQCFGEAKIIFNYDP